MFLAKHFPTLSHTQKHFTCFPLRGFSFKILLMLTSPTTWNRRRIYFCSTFGCLLWKFINRVTYLNSFYSNARVVSRMTIKIPYIKVKTVIFYPISPSSSFLQKLLHKRLFYLFIKLWKNKNFPGCYRFGIRHDFQRDISSRERGRAEIKNSFGNNEKCCKWKFA